ncbi:MAG TPA: NUDIX domain-containing protein [Chitinophagaceae bacterium]|nr:NUDIX domain-containing protein [Chitinophagaceae bacterium]
MSKKSAGLLLYRKRDHSLLFFLVHPGGPFWKNKDRGAWSIPKGEFTGEEDPLAAAKREFEEETGLKSPEKFLPLTPVKQKSGKLIFAWAAHATIEPEHIQSNFFELEWPPHSGKKQLFPEIDKADWFEFKTAKEKIIPGQLPFLEELARLLHKE